VGTQEGIELDTDLREYLKACVAQRVVSISGFTLQFVEDDQIEWFGEYYHKGMLLPWLASTFLIASLDVFPRF
jgi:hypothetical protein